MGVTPNYSFVLCIVKKILAEFAGWFECDHHIRKDREILHLRHDLGMKWSIYVAGAAYGTFRSILKEEVDADEIARVVSSWTGIPVVRLLESEMQKLRHMEDRLHRRILNRPTTVVAG